ncbi:MAG: hypothetical protein NTY36_00625 [Deltaproteobacteria bacterium]|nr:hypothetical protein [Deltaproteobacteria bacterium]
MRIPTFCGLSEFHRSLTSNSQEIATVLDSFDSGCFSESELNSLIMAARRTAFICSELIKWRNLKTLVEAATKEEDPDMQAMHWE